MGPLVGGGCRGNTLRASADYQMNAVGSKEFSRGPRGDIHTKFYVFLWIDERNIVY
jgi:hypothetical protein